jgi:hypothetical protein
MIYKYRRYQGQVPTDLTAPPSYPVYFYFLLFVLYELQVSSSTGSISATSKYIQGRSQTYPCSGSHLLLRATGPLLYGPDANILGSIRCDACCLIPSVCLDHQPALPLPEEWVWPDLWSLHEPHLPYFRTDIRSIQPGSPGNTLSILPYLDIFLSLQYIRGTQKIKRSHPFRINRANRDRRHFVAPAALETNQSRLLEVS